MEASGNKALMVEKAQTFHDEQTKGLGSHGTALVHDQHLFQEDSEGQVVKRLLLPRPTNDPRDPLTWSVWRKHSAFLSISFFVFLSNYITASIVPVLYPIAIELELNGQQASYLLTLNILLLGVGNLFWIPISRKIGKRPVLILCSIIFFTSCIWNAVCTSFGSMIGARIMQGFGASASEALGPAIVADLYFLHERGSKVGMYTFMIASGSAIGSIFAGLVARANSDWRWVFWMDSVLTGTCFLITVLFQPESNFDRPIESETGEEPTAPVVAEIQRSKYSWTKSLSIWAWYDRETRLVRLFWRPISLLRYPAVVWGSLTYGIALGWVVLQQTANAAAFPVEYGFSSFGVGNIGTANLIGSVIGCAVGGIGSDYFVAAMSKRRNGYFKPEFRLWMMIPPFIFAPIGLMLWGAGLENRLHSMVAIAGSGITYGVLCAVPAIGMTYVVDCYRPFAGETMTILTAFKNTFAFGLSFGVAPWVTNSGYLKVAGYSVLIESIIFASTIPMYIYGERLRQWTNKL